MTSVHSKININCHQCGKLFTGRRSNIAKRGYGFCSHHCSRLHQMESETHIDEQTRFWSKVNKGADDECWEWQGRTAQGYGRFDVKRDGAVGSDNYGWLAIKAHRYSWETTNKRSAEGLFICHTCDNPRCVNPNHLFPGTQTDNMQDCVRKGRHWSQRYPNKVYRAKLTEEQVREIRRLVGNNTYPALARMYGVAKGTIGSIARRQSWKHLR